MLNMLNMQAATLPCTTIQPSATSCSGDTWTLRVPSTQAWPTSTGASCCLARPLQRLACCSGRDPSVTCMALMHWQAMHHAVSSGLPG